MSDYSRNSTPSQMTSTSGAGSTGPESSAAGHQKKIKLISKSGPATLFSDPFVGTIEALSELKTNGYTRESDSGMNIVDKSQEVLNAIGFTMVDVEELSPGLGSDLKNFSLLGTTNVDETISNSKIIDPDLNKLTPIKQSAEDKFKDQSDSFYDLDEERSESVKKITKKEILRSPKSRTSVKIANIMVRSVKVSHNKMLSKTSKRSIKR